jgi:MFS family permease
MIFSVVFAVGAVGISHIWFLSFLIPHILHQILQTIAGGSRGLGYIYAGRVISGLGIGAISAVAPAYVSECSPKEVRGRITGMFQVLVATGVMVSYFINCTSPLSSHLHESDINSRWRQLTREVGAWHLAYPVRFPARPRWYHVLWPSIRY